ncbi:unnamed protein product [Caenorhabditis bovis]|uniref:RING-type E3 ubiquitin transferase (cysteine targeting) n=1 Tax=Caenorhabditis bovis TaxID=2654633 RepID=A0A8S1EXH6_9PELO|nr:unnamed protein product [Caenorhabditis bovis]
MACQCLRIDQLDSHVLDEEIRNITIGSIEGVLKTIPIRAGRIFEKLRPEWTTIIDAVLWSHRYFTGSSHGQQEMDISYKDYTPRKVAAHFIISVFLPYLGNRITHLSGNIEWSRVYAKFEAIIEMLSLMHFFVFLRHGGHSTISESILSLRNWNNNQPQLNSVNYDTQNRELMWHAFRDLLVLIYPIFDRVRERVVRRQKLARTCDNDSFECVVCDKPPVIPMIGDNCRHVACYTCVASQSKTAMSCPVCDEEPSKMRFAVMKKIN